MPQVQFDNSVFNVKPVPLEMPQNALANALKIADARQQYEANAFALDNARQESARQNALAQILGRGGFNPQTPEGQAELYRAGGVKGAQTFMKGQADIDKVKSDASKASTETEIKVLGMHRDELANVRNPQEMAQWMAAIRKDPRTTDFYTRMGSLEEAVARIPQTPQEFEEFRQKIAMGMTKYTEMNKPQFVTRNLGGTTDTISTEGMTGKTRVVNSALNTQSPDNFATNERMAKEGAANRAVSIRGQNMTDARSRESNAASMSKPFEVTGEDGKPVLVRQDKQGNISRVEGYLPKSGADKPMTDAQSKAALFGSRMQESDRIINELAKAGTDKGIPFSNAGFGVGNVVTAVGGAKNQQLQQAKRDFVNATLRRESGAVISPSEFENAEKQYFPQIGDSDAVIAQKAKNRAIATRGVQAEIPKGQRGVVNDIIGGSKSIDDLLNKYK